MISAEYFQMAQTKKIYIYVYIYAVLTLHGSTGLRNDCVK